MKIWFLKKMIILCNLAISSDHKGEQHEVNEIVEIKNYFIGELNKLSN